MRGMANGSGVSNWQFWTASLTTVLHCLPFLIVTKFSLQFAGIHVIFVYSNLAELFSLYSDIQSWSMQLPTAFCNIIIINFDSFITSHD